MGTRGMAQVGRPKHIDLTFFGFAADGPAAMRWPRPDPNRPSTLAEHAARLLGMPWRLEP